MTCSERWMVLRIFFSVLHVHSQPNGSVSCEVGMTLSLPLSECAALAIWLLGTRGMIPRHLPRPHPQSCSPYIDSTATPEGQQRIPRTISNIIS
jgi:hypothetical protein